jgi:hypothetical protein
MNACKQRIAMDNLGYRDTVSIADLQQRIEEAVQFQGQLSQEQEAIAQLASPARSEN